MTFVGVVSVVTCLVAGGIYIKTKRPGPTLTALIGGGIIIAAKDTSVMQSIGTAIGSIIQTAAAAIPSMFSGG
jgi:hypothetical protein